MMGWDSNTYRYTRGNTATDETKYSDTTGSTWFFRNWWALYKICKKYTNDTKAPMKLKSLAFLACAGHSGNKVFKTTGGPGRRVYGAGCNFYVDIYIKDKTGEVIYSKTKVGGGPAGRVESISSTNSSYNGEAGQVTNKSLGTKFGIHNNYTGNKSLYKERRILTLPDNVPAVPAGGKLLVHIYAEDNNSDWWAPSNLPEGVTISANNSLLVVKFDGSAQGEGTGNGDGQDSFQPDMEPEQTDYIWRMTADGWKKERMVHVMTEDGWKKMKGD